jgi:tetratricopeptide (TPR) repeat protein
LLSGSVRRVNDRVHITAQLVQVKDGLVVWIDSYDRELADMVGLQTEIAYAVADAVRGPLEKRENSRLAGDGNIDVDTYESYLRAKALLRGRTPGAGLERALTLLQTVVQRSPEFAPGWASLATAYELVPVYSTAILTGSAAELRRLRNEHAERANEAAQRAIRLDPELPEGYIALASIAMSRRDVTQAFEHITKALSLDPTNPDVLAAYRNLLLGVGSVEMALAVQERVAALEPFVPRFQTNLATNLWVAGQDTAAIQILSAPAAKTSEFAQVRLAMIFAAAGNYGKAADVLTSMPPGAFSGPAINAAVRILRTAPARISFEGFPQLGALGFVYLHGGEPSRVVEFYETSMDGGFAAIAPLWQQAYAPVRRTERFKQFVQKDKLPEFWRARGWPQFCHPVGSTDFACS